MSSSDRAPNWRRKVTAALIMAAVTPLVVAVTARTAVDLLGPVVPYAIGLLVLLVLYRLLFGARWR